MREDGKLLSQIGGIVTESPPRQSLAVKWRASNVRLILVNLAVDLILGTHIGTQPGVPRLMPPTGLVTAPAKSL